MQIFIALIVISFLILVHELGHAYILHQLGVPIKEAGLGVPLPKLTLSFHIKGVRINISPLLLGGYIKADEGKDKQIQNAPYHKKIMYYGGGILANVIVSLPIFIIYYLLDPTSNLVGNVNVIKLVSAAYLAGLLILFSRKIPILAHFVPVICMAIMIFIIASILKNPSDIAGPIGIIHIIASKQAFSLVWTLKFSFVLSIGLILMNLLPILPLDGGLITNATLNKLNLKSIVPVFKIASILITICFFLFIIINDSIRIFC